MNTQKLRWKKRKYFIRINCGIMIALLVAILLLMGFPIVSNAEGITYEDTLSSHLGINEESLLTYDNVDQEENYTYFLYDDTVYSRYFDDDLSNGSIIWDSSIDSFTYNGYSISDSVSYYAYFQSETEFNIDFYFIDLECKFFKESANSSLHCLYSYPNDIGVLPNPNKLIRLRFTKSSDGNFYLYNGYPVGYDRVLNFGNQFTNGDFDAFANFNVQNPILTNVNVYSLPTSPFLQKNSYTIGDVTVNDWVSADNGIQINPNISSGEDDSVYPDGSGGTPLNNLYLRSADWKFNVSKFWGSVTSQTAQPQYVNNWLSRNSGNIAFYGLVNDYQQGNFENFKLRFNFHIWCSGHYFNDTNSSINGNFYGSFNYNNVEVNLIEFENNNNIVNFSVYDIFTHATLSSDSLTHFNDWLHSEAAGHQSYNNWNWYITCDACLVADNTESGHIVEKYDFISQVSTEQSNNITTNNNPYIPPSDSGFDPDININNPDNGTSTTSSNGNITINNNPTFNNGYGSDNESGGFIGKLIDRIFGNGTVQEGSIGGNVKEHLLSMTGANSWLAIMNDSFSFIPFSIWAELTLFLGITLGILVVAFILRVILDFL